MTTTEISESEIAKDRMIVADILVKCSLAKSKGEAKRLIEQGGISIDGNNIADAFQKISINHNNK